MLTILFRDEVEEINIEHDIEKMFDEIELKLTDKEKEAVIKIEKAELLDNYSFKDRFGYKLYTSELSTGCKAALCILNKPERIIDVIECGLNARDTIISICNKGKIILGNESITIAGNNDDIDVEIDGYNITSIDRLNRYIQNERPFKPDMSTGDIRCIN